MSEWKSVKVALGALKKGKIIIVTDAPDRESEGDLVMAAQFVTPKAVNFMMREGRGLICAPLTRERAEELALQPMVPMEQNSEVTKCDFTISVDAKRGITTGVSAQDRAVTIELLASAKTRPYDLARPGHVFPLRAHPGGVLYRAGHTEAAVDLLKLAGLTAVGVICEVLGETGESASGTYLSRLAEEYKLPMLSIEELIEYRRACESIVTRVASAKLPTEFGAFDLYIYRSLISGLEHVALVKGKIRSDRPTLLRVHSQCLTGDTFHSLRCDCRAQLTAAMKRIAKEGSGAVVYLNQEGRGIGLTNKARAYALQEHGADTVSANEKLGLPVDMRDWNVGSQIVADLGIKKIRLMTN
ncbi:bifunctional 3,4-dihydroxy-2-butanone 4-phosphate synthase/GTP cyclohydrolase II, partial [Candidatus Uhrbacteria bacterium RIFCSPLOWO2_02_FULL_54_37]